MIFAEVPSAMSVVGSIAGRGATVVVLLLKLRLMGCWPSGTSCLTEISMLVVVELAGRKVMLTESSKRS
ncbi:hypothetical protein ACFJGX_21725 [Hydrogenophaga sp. UC242_50]|uniref:hypothetical protein n=1 Tax=Hydrogenophaga sp. UC242_50 TaxID=3350169 RepID=UPI0036D4223A